MTIAGATGLQVKTGSTAQVKVDGVEYMTVGLSRFTQEKLNAGEATVQAFSLESGKQSTPAKINVVASTEVKTLSIGNGPKTIVAGEDAELSYSAVDADGKAVTDYEVLKRVALTGGKGGKGVRFVKRAGKAVLLYTPAAPTTIDRAQIEYISYVTQTNNVGSATVTVNPVRQPVKVSGFKKDTATSATLGNDIKIKLDKVVIKDQYGDDFSADKLGNDYALRVEFGSDDAHVFTNYGANASYDKTVTYAAVIANFPGSTVNTGNPVVVAASASAVTAGSVTASISLVKKSGAEVEGSAYKFSITAAKINEVRNVKIDDLSLQKASVSGTPGTTSKIDDVDVYGTVDGKQVKLVKGMDYDIVAGTDVVPYDTTLDKVDTIGKASVSIVLKGSGQVISKEYQYSKAKSVLTTAKLQDNATLATAAAIGATQLKGLFDLEDQYDIDISGNVNAADMYVTFSNVDLKKVSNNGLSNASLDGSDLASGDVITVKIVFGNSKVVFEGDIKIR